MQGHLKKIGLWLLMLGLLDLAIPQSVNQNSTASNSNFMIGTKEPEFEIIPIHKSVIRKRSTNEPVHLSFEAFGEHIKLWLEPNSGILASLQTPIFRIDGAGVITEYQGLMGRIARDLYHNEKEAATVVITETPDGIFHYDGIIGRRNLAIRPASDSFQGANQLQFQTERFKRFIENTPEHELGNYAYHIVSKVANVSDHLKTPETPTLNFSRTKRSLVPDVIYPEIMVVVDYSLFAKFGFQYYPMVKYLLSFWNSVDFKYRSLKNPQWRLNIAGILIAEQPNSLSYLRHTLPFHPYDLLAGIALEDSAEFVWKLEKLFQNTYSFDVVITMTSKIFCMIDNGLCKRGTVGLAFLSGACSLPNMQWNQGIMISENPFKSGMLYDRGGYDGVNVVAHELGHLFGAEHDGQVNDMCSSNVGNLMTPIVSYNANSSDWSSCTLGDMETFLNSQSSQCLFNEPKFVSRMVRFLPGRMMSADAQCQAFGGNGVSEVNEMICVNLPCLGYPETQVLKYPGAADGTTCGQNKMCLHRQCIDISNITD